MYQQHNKTVICCLCASLIICMYVCTYVRMYVCMYVCTYVLMYVCMYVRMYVCMYVCMYVRTYVCTYVCMYVYKLICQGLLVTSWSSKLPKASYQSRPLKYFEAKIRFQRFVSFFACITNILFLVHTSFMIRWSPKNCPGSVNTIFNVG